MVKKHILVIDDDAELCEQIAEILADEGYLVKSASDPAVGLSLIDAYKFDIAILDYKLPGMTGLDLLNYIKKDNPGTRVFIVSGMLHLSKLIKEKNASRLVSGIISKPFDCEELLKRIKES